MRSNYRSYTTSFSLLDCPSGGNLVGGIVGLFFRVLVGRQAWLAMALSCATAIAAMEATSLQYPPGMLSNTWSHAACLLAAQPHA